MNLMLIRKLFKTVATAWIFTLPYCFGQNWLTNPPVFSASPIVDASTVLTMNAETASVVEIHVGSPDGPLLYRGGGSGTATATGWVTDGLTFYLEDVSEDQPRTLANAIAMTTATDSGATFTSTPPVILSPDVDGTGILTLNYRVPNARLVEIHLGSPQGQLFALLGGPSGKAITGEWVSNGMKFVLCDVTFAPCSSQTSVATYTANVADALPGEASIVADPNPLILKEGESLGQVKLYYQAPRASTVEIHIDAPDGPLFARTGPNDSALTGPWVKNGMRFYLQDVTNGSPGITIASTTARLILPLNISCWGDSLTLGTGSPPGLPYPAVLQTLIAGSKVINDGIGGQTSTQIEERFLADSSDRGDFAVIWVGRNNYGETTQILSDVKNMVDALPDPKRFVVLSVLNGDFPNEYAGQSGYKLIKSVNDALKLAYSDNFIDIRSYLVSQANPKNSQDLIDYKNDVPPASLRSDAIHLTATGYALVAQRVANFILNNTEL